MRKLFSGRWSTRYFSWRKAPLIAGLFLLALHFALLPWAADARPGVAAARVFPLYAGLVLTVWGFTGRGVVPQTVHKTLVVALCLVPTVFAGMTFVSLLISLVVGLWAGSAGLWYVLAGTAVSCLVLVCLALLAWWSARKYPLAAYADYPREIDPRSRFAAVAVLLLCFGFMGFHRFYCGRIVTGTLWFFTGGLFGVGYVLDIVLLFTGRFKDGKGNPVVAGRKAA